MGKWPPTPSTRTVNSVNIDFAVYRWPLAMNCMWRSNRRWTRTLWSLWSTNCWVGLKKRRNFSSYWTRRHSDRSRSICWHSGRIPCNSEAPTIQTPHTLWYVNCKLYNLVVKLKLKLRQLWIHPHTKDLKCFTFFGLYLRRHAHCLPFYQISSILFRKYIGFPIWPK